MIYTVCNAKGGSGKTTTAAALLQAAAIKGKKALGVDLDSQSNLTYCLAAETGTPGTYEALLGTPAAETIQTTEQKIDVMAASWNLQTLNAETGAARRLERALEPIKNDYDLIIIDTPPTPGILQYNAMQAADGLIITLQSDIYNIRSLQHIEATAKEIQKTNPGLFIAGIVLTQYDKRPIMNRQLRGVIEETAAAHNIPLLGSVRKGVAIQEAAAMGQSIYTYGPKSNPAQDYLTIYENLMKNEKRRA